MHDNLSLKIAASNSEKEYHTKLAEVPVQIGMHTYSVPCIVVPTINVSITLNGLKSVADSYRSKGYILADTMIDKRDKICNLDFILGTKSAYILKSNEICFGVNQDSIYAETELGIMIMGDLDKMKSNMPYLRSRTDTRSNIAFDQVNPIDSKNVENFGYFNGQIVTNSFFSSVDLAINDDISEVELEKEACRILNKNKNEFKFDILESDNLSSEQNKNLMDWA